MAINEDLVVKDMVLRKVDQDRQVEIAFKTKDGDIKLVILGKSMARRLQRSLFLAVGVNSHMGTGRETLPDFVEGIGRED